MDEIKDTIARKQYICANCGEIIKLKTSYYRLRLYRLRLLGGLEYDRFKNFTVCCLICAGKVAEKVEAEAEKMNKLETLNDKLDEIGSPIQENYWASDYLISLYDKILAKK